MTAEAHSAGPASQTGAGPSTPIRARTLVASDIVVTERFAGVTITRRQSGGCFLGVKLEQNADDPADSEISLLRRDGLEILIARSNDADVVAEWRRASRDFGQPMVLQSPDAGVIALEGMFGPLARGKASPSRRLKALTRRRRPRFLTRRQTGRLPLAPVIHDAEGGC